jgi:hypothetical protein
MPNIYHKIKISKVNIVKEYMDFRLSNITSEEFVRKSLEELRTLMRVDPAEHIYPLITAHLHIVSNNTDKAKEILSIYEKNEKELIDTERFVYAYYVYLKCLFFEDLQLQHRGSMIISQIAEKLTSDWRAQWLRLYIDESIIKNKLLKMNLFQEISKCNSPIMFFELCTLLNEYPTLLRKLEGFELQALLWGANKNYINNELSNKIILIVNRLTTYNKLVYKLLARLYRTYQDKEFIRAICNLLIIGERKDKEANAWYKIGIEEQIRVNGLNEYYIASIDRSDISMLPQTLIRYFVYNTEIDDESKEYIYANIIMNQTPQAVELYQKQILVFAEEQLAKKKMNCFLARIYIYVMETLDIPRFMQKLLEVTFIHKLICKNEKMKLLVVTYTDIEREVIIPLENSTAYFEIYSPNYVISFQGIDNIRYSRGIVYSIESVLSDISYVKEAYVKGIYSDRSLVYLASEAVNHDLIDDKVVTVILKVLTLKGLTKSYRSNLAYKVLSEYEINNDNYSLILNLIKAVELDCLSYPNIVKMIDFYINFKMVDEAIHAINEYGAYDLTSDSLCLLCEHMLHAGLYDNIMLSICERLFAEGNHNENIIAYLIKFYDTSINKLEVVWRKAVELGFNATALEERAIEQMIFIEATDVEYMPMVVSYSKDNINSPLMENYLRFCSYSFLLGLKTVPNQIIDIIQKRLGFSGENSVYEYVLIKYYSMKKDLTYPEIQWTQQIAQKFYKQKKLVSWFKNFGDEVILPSDLYERSYIEYFSSSIAKVVVHYRYNFEEGYIEQEMKQVAEGLFVGSVLLFYNESFQYYIEEIMDDITNIVSSERFVIEENRGLYIYDINSSNYEQINSMLIARKENDSDKLDRILDQYIERENKITTYFKPL